MIFNFRFMNREEMIQFIRRNEEFYLFVQFAGYSIEQLSEVVERIEVKIEQQESRKALQLQKKTLF
jgi:hypothetical protein